MVLIVKIITVIAIIFSGCCGEEVEDSKLVGCFSTSSLDGSVDHTTVRPLTWEICANLCQNQATRYVGVQASTNICYCMQDLDMIPSLLSSTDCGPCHEDFKRFCGGDLTMSVYELPAHVSDLLLVATPNGIKQLYNSNTMRDIADLSQNATTVDFHYKLHYIFYSSKNKLFRSSYMPHLMKYFSPTIIYESEHAITDFIVDWTNEYIYMSILELSSCYRMKLDGSELEGFLINLEDSYDMAIDPYSRVVFAKQKNNLLSYDLSKFNHDILGKYKVKNIKSVAVDIHQDTVYVIGSYEGINGWHLASIDYNYTHFRVLYSGPELSDPFGLEVLDDRLFWVNRQTTKYTVYKAHLSIRGYLQNITVVYEGKQVINRIKIYHPDAQTPSNEYLCKMKSCSQQCTPVSHRFAKCSCSRGMSLAGDGVTCVDTTTTASVTAYPVTTQTSIHVGSPEEYPDSSTDSWDYWTTDASTPGDSSSASVTTDQPPMKPIPSQAVERSYDSDNSSLLIHLIFDIIIVCFLLVILLLVIKQQSQFRKSKMIYNVSSELTELTFSE